MLKFRIITLALLLCSAVSASAQRVALEERVPKIKSKLWFEDREPQKAEYTYIEFVHSQTVPSIQTFLQIKKDHAYFNENLRAIIVTKEKPEQISTALRECATDYVNIAFDTDGEIFRTFGVRYVPFGIIINKRRKALWFGNPTTIDEDFFSKIKLQNNDTH